MRLEKAIELLKSGKYKEANEILESLLKEEPENQVIYYNLGMSYSDTNNLNKAIEMLKKATEIDPSFINAYTALGVAYSRNGEKDKAIKSLKKSLKYDPNNLYSLKNIASIYADQKNYKEAKKYFEKAYLLYSEDLLVQYGLALLYKDTGDLDQANKLFLRIITEDLNDQITGLSKKHLTEIAAKQYKSVGPRMDAVMYLLGAMERFSKMDIDRIKNITYEIAIVGTSGFEVNDPEKKYTLTLLDGEFTGIHLVCIMYVGFRKIGQNFDIGIDLEKEYESAMKLFKEKS